MEAQQDQEVLHLMIYFIWISEKELAFGMSSMSETEHQENVMDIHYHILNLI